MKDWLIAALAGAATGVLSGFGVGGGSLLLIYMTSFAGVPQTLAQGINLLYFLPAGLMALPAHVKNGYIEKPALLPAIGAGLACAALAAWGADAQTLMVFEEMAELQKELCKHARGKDNREAIAEEIADVQIMLGQMMILHQCERLVEAYRSQKMERLARRLEDAQ